ncbi:hypothetical protein AGMMS50293_01010 [Spirochaetia bacterium]|nr:hypothetical protein AGMMS50293_01010 [Spirochaetia bacterium]
MKTQIYKHTLHYAICAARNVLCAAQKVFCAMMFFGITLFCTTRLSAFDFGLTLHQTLDFSGSGTESVDTAYTAGLGPWVSATIGDNMDLYLSAFVNMKYEYNSFSGDGNWNPVLEPGLCSFIYRLPGLSLEAGRILYGDPNGLILSGLFDGASGTFGIKDTRLSLGLYYTGLLNQETAKIQMTAADMDYNYAWGEAVFSFAGRRVLATANWEWPSIFETPHGLAVNALAQFDVNDSDDKLHSQYLSFRFLYSPWQFLNVNAGAAFGFSQAVTTDETNQKFNVAFNLDAEWAPPTPVTDLARFGISWGSGGENIGAFRPVTLLSPSSVLSNSIAGLVTLKGAYIIRPLENFSLRADIRYFFREKLDTFGGLTLVEDGGKKALGGEIAGSAVWSPVSDISLTGGAAFFFPGRGNAIASGTPPQWKLSLTLALSF